MLERDIQRKIIKYLKSCGIFTTKIDSTSGRGIPDLLCIDDGRVLFLEVKNERGRLTKLQEIKIKEMQSHGASVHVVRSVEDVRAIIEG